MATTHPTYTAPSPLRRRAVLMLPGVLVAGFVYFALPMAMGSILVAALLLAGLIGLTMVMTLGLERTALVLVFVAVFGSPMDALKPVAALSFASASDLVLVAGLLVLAPVLMRKPLPDHSLLVLGAAGLVTSALFSSALSDDTIPSLNNLLRIVVGALVVLFAFAWWRPGKQVVVALAVAFVGGNCFNTLYARIEGTASVEGRYPGLSNHVNVLGFCAMLAIALVPFLLATLPRRYHWLALVGGLICAYGVWISGSRAALGVAVVIVAVYPLIARSVTAALVLLGAGLAPLYIVGRMLLEGEQSTNPIGRLLGGGSATLSDVAREQLAAEALLEFQTHPWLGIGFAKAMEAHNIYLQLASAAGLIGVGFFVIILIAVVRQSFLLEAQYRLLVLPAIAYVIVGAMTTLIWDRFIWFVLALPFLMLPAKRSEASVASQDVETLTSEVR